MRKILAALPRQSGDEVGGEAAVALAWALAAGPRLAPRARCVELKGGVLHLELASSDDSSARRQIESIGAELLQGLQRSLGADRIRGLRLD